MTDERTDRAADERTDATAANRRYEDWPVEGDPDDSRDGGPEYVGTVEGGAAWHYDERDDELFETDPDSENRRLVRSGESRPVDSDAGFGAAVERLGDELGWESLSAFARKHLEDDDRPERDD